MMNPENNDIGENRFMTPLSVILEKLRVRGIESEFRWKPEGFTTGTGKFYQPDELVILKTYRFEGDSDPADNAILYLIKAIDGLTGYSLDMYGVYSSHEQEQGYDEFIARIPVNGGEDQQAPEENSESGTIW